ncbi:uncharacterized protein LOC143516413 [Brachyhypopomus gauderio]|uniref:uncharacterized protein LOC143516413 n=1 Tax=Brachyhypopomus gauderio TaxID=698409 RepID=UPI004040FC31
MILLSLLCVLLGLPCAHAKVVQDYNECKDFFYKRMEPRGMDQNSKKICQEYKKSFHFASLYSTSHRIPLYSAYTFNTPSPDEGRHPGCIPDTQEQNLCNRPRNEARKAKWLIEPQLSGLAGEAMRKYTASEIPVLKEMQAINEDYSDTGYDRGHLNPFCFQCSPDSREATCTLTNGAPMDACFNRVHWYQWESEVRKIIKSELHRDEATAYLVTGTVPSPNDRIPHEGEYVEQQVIDTERVTVPTHVWTALCYFHKTDNSKSFSLAFIGRNQPDSNIEVMPVSELNNKLKELYNSASQIEIFTDDCFSKNKKSQKIVNQLYKHIQLPFSQRLQIPPNVMNTLHTAISGQAAKRARMTDVHIVYSFDNTDSLNIAVESMKYVSETSCLLNNVQSTQQKRYLAGKSEGIQCLLVPEQSDDEAGSPTAADGTPCVQGSVSSDGTSCKTKSGSKSRCTSPCLYQETVRDYRCSSGPHSIACSPQYSVITATGKKCSDSCATYGNDYYWCNTQNSWDYCSPPLWRSITKKGLRCRTNHACAKYGSRYYWCYTDEHNNWDYCCRHDDRYSTVDGKSCKELHPCGYHGKNYLWCYTTDGSWAECCKRG